MRFPDPRFQVAAALLVLASNAFGAANEVRADIVARLRGQLPSATAADYAMGAGAFDEERRAELERMLPNPDTAAIVEAGRVIWTRKFKGGKNLASCFPNGGRRIAGAYPQYDQRLKRVVTLEIAINLCLKANNESPFDPAQPQTMGAALAYLRSLSDGQKVSIRVAAGAAEERFDQGRRLYFTRIGQKNFACASCHLQGAGRRYANVTISPALGQATHWPLIRGAQAVTMQARIRECLELMGAAPFAAGADELVHLEYFLGYLSNGLVLKANPAR